MNEKDRTFFAVLSFYLKMILVTAHRKEQIVMQNRKS